ncbi:AmmeMemoRadiSam system radical SAM enzyme [Myxococcota bacterium]|nr:AmmeMemoRadiSam system radical SAM enzyme [Myxococcota bacterium]MBU1538019.1 AmmeMemoRadiSam system radical SAM enzyme [Myxococcota bacterium]
MSTVQCDLCPKACRLSEGESGDCRIRYNMGGKLVALTYGRPAAIQVDPVEKKPLFHFLPGSKVFSLATAGCNLHCKNCQNAGLSQANPLERKAYSASPETIVASATKKGCAGIALTYSDPVVFYEYALDIAKRAREKRLKVVWVTAGYINPAPLARALPLIDAANLDIKSMSDSFYRSICNATLAPVLATAEAMLRAGVWLEITNLVIPSLNDTDKDVKNLATFMVTHLSRDVPLHFSRFFPHYQLRNIPPTPPETLIRAREIAQAQGVRHVYIGNMRHLPGTENTLCPACGITLIERYGYHIISNRLQRGACPGCHRALPGVWS